MPGGESNNGTALRNATTPTAVNSPKLSVTPATHTASKVSSSLSPTVPARPFGRVGASKAQPPPLPPRLEPVLKLLLI